ncbi:unnamed protein product [Rotaria sp. Silwood1]|nr:unnamed protein product [Rotaria sp. Silwood1]CAF1632086.1 unnamed protein product [Rotaria sp. Silwood1]
MNKNLYDKLELTIRTVFLVINCAIAIEQIYRGILNESISSIGLALISVIDICCYTFMKINIESTTMVQLQPTETEQLHILIPQEQRIYESTV